MRVSFQSDDTMVFTPENEWDYNWIRKELAASLKCKPENVPIFDSMKVACTKRDYHGYPISFTSQDN